MPRPLRRSVPRRSHVISRGETSSSSATPRLLSDAEKHELILAHTEHHRTRPESWGLGYAVGLVASCLVVALGWFATLNVNLRSGLSTAPDPAWVTVQDRLRGLKQDWQKQKPANTEEINKLRTQYEAAKKQATTESTTHTTTTNPER